MAFFTPAVEPYPVSPRFRISLEAAILALQAAAAQDERNLALLQDQDHRRRHSLLVAAQLERAFRLNELLECTSVLRDRAA